MSGEAIVLVSHGARDRAWAAPLERLADMLRERRKHAWVRLAYLDSTPPDLLATLEALYREGARSIRVVPMFLGAGGHVVKDVGHALGTARRLRPDLRIELEPAVGERAPVIYAIAAELAVAPEETP